jgi:FkbM family methyltransferase
MNVGSYIYEQIKINNGFYVDIGANDGILGDETYFLERIGWEGICIEAHPVIYERLRQNRNCLTYHAFVGRKSNETREFVQLSPQYYGSGLRDNLPEGHQQFLRSLDNNLNVVQVQTKHLEDILDELNAPKRITLLKSDTEGECLEIIKSLSFTKYIFDFISLELGLPKVPDTHYEEGVEFLVSKGYKHLISFNQNDIFQLIL